MKNLIIFGNGKIADVLYYYFSEHSEYEVVCFTTDNEYITSESFNNLPQVNFEKIESLYPPNYYDMFIAIGYQDMNELREKKLNEAKEKGYKIASFIFPGDNVPKDLKYGENTFIMNNVSIHPKVALGNNNFVWSGTIIGHHSRIGNNNWLTSGTNISGNVEIGNNCFFAINSTTGHSIKIGNRCFLGSNSLVVKNIEDESVFIEQSSKLYRLNSSQFLKFSRFSDI